MERQRPEVGPVRVRRPQVHPPAHRQDLDARHSPLQLR